METKRHLKGLVEKGEDGKLSVAIGSDESVDRYGEVIEASAWDLTDFQKNPVMLLIHDYWDLPVGRCDDTRVEDGRLLFSPNFAVEIYDKAKLVHDMYQNDYMSAFSVGFIGKRGEMRDVKETNRDTGQVEDKRRWVWTDVELLEISCVPVPANPNALVESKTAVEAVEGLMKKAMETMMPTGKTFETALERAVTGERAVDEPEAEPEGKADDTAASDEPGGKDDTAAEGAKPDETAGGDPGTGDDPAEPGEGKVETAAAQSRNVLTAGDVQRALVEADKAIGKALRQMKRRA